jgi:hypothetical protein
MARALTKDKANPAKKKNKRKGRKKTASFPEVKNQTPNRAKKPTTSFNVAPVNTTSADSSKERTDASQVYDNFHNLSNALNGMVLDKCLDNSCKFDDLVTSNKIVINKRTEQGMDQIDTSEKVEEMLIPPLTPLNQTRDIPKPTLDPRHPFWEGGPPNFDMPFAPPTQHHVLPHPPLALPFSCDWPPVYRNYDRMNDNNGLANDFIDDSEAYYLSEEEMDYNFPYSERGYNQFFGGGVMYWSPADYGSGNANGSFCSDDSAWAWHEADVNRVIEEMTVLPSPSPSPPTRAASITGSDNGLEDSKPSLAPVKSSGNSCCGDILPYMLRPINVPSGITRRGSRSELKPAQEYHRSPCIPSSARREPSRVKRPPSPVVLCVPQVPRPPPPSPVGEFGRRRAGGWPMARSGSSSPRNWGMRGAFSEEKGFVEKGQVLLDGPEVVWPKSGLTMMQPFQGTPVLQEHLMKITQFSRDQQHVRILFILLV